MFGNKLDIEASCLNPQCSGTIVAQFEGRKETETCDSNCSSCQQKYLIRRTNFDETPNNYTWMFTPLS